MSSFMGKKVNMFLLLMLMLVLIGFGGVSVYSQYTFKNLKQEYENASTGLSTCQLTLSQTNTSLTSLRRELNSTTTDIRKYDALYEQKAAELDQKKTDLANTQAELNLVHNYLIPAIKSVKAVPSDPAAYSELVKKQASLKIKTPGSDAPESRFAGVISGKEFALQDNDYQIQSVYFSFKDKECSFGEFSASPVKG